MKHTALILAGIALSAATATAGTPAPMDKNPPPPADPCAGPISYTNIELLYERTNFSGNSRSSDDGNAGVIRYEYGIKDFYFNVDVDRNSYDYTVPTIRDQSLAWKVDEWKVRASLGGHIALRDNIHLAGDVGIVYSNRDGKARAIGATVAREGFNDDDVGWYIRPQLRAKWGCWTLHAGGEYEDIGGDDHWSVFGRVYYQISPQWDLMLGAATGDDADVYSGGIRWRF
jgi:hypothetical protein